MSAEDQLRSIFDRASEMPRDQRAAFLDLACKDNPQLRREVESLLKSLDSADGFLVGANSEIEHQALPGSERGTRIQSPFDRAIGSYIGPYKLLEKIGEGGMGFVYRAEQKEPVAREVALKVIKPGMDTSAVIARFEAERQALALMEHSNIARVYDAGTTREGRPYFVMELVRGQAITKYCDQNRLNPQQRLELFITICQAVEHAHQKGIIHRDLKPANVLVLTENGKPIVKVIDFGIARAVDRESTEQSQFTEFGMFVGTPEYMSPEQAGASTQHTDTRSDVYALGVILYELLTGSTPLDRAQLRQAGYEQMMKTIREVDPPKPSTRLSTLGKQTASASAQRGMEPRTLARLLDGDLDVIVMKCLEKDRTRRYQTATGLANDVERFLNHDPVEAVPASTFYILRRYAWKHRVWVSITAAFVLLAAAFMIVTSIVFWVKENQASRQRDIAVNAKTVAERATAHAEQASYVASIFAASAAVGHEDLADADSFLDDAPTGLRNWEWRYLHALANPQVITLQSPVGTDGSYYIKDGSEIVITRADASIHFFNAATGQELRAITNLAKGLRPFAISPDAQRIIAEKRDLSLVVLDAAGNVLVPVDLHQPAYVYATRFTADHSRFITSSPDRSLRLWDTTTGRQVRDFPGSTSEITFTRFSRDESKLLTGSLDGVAKIWDVSTGKCLVTHRDSTRGMSFSSFSPDETQIVTCTDGSQRQAVIWDAGTGRELRSFTTGLNTANNLSAEFSPDGKYIAVAGGRFGQIFDAHTGQQVSVLRGNRGRVTSAVFSPDGLFVMTSSNDNSTRIWNLHSPDRPLVMGSSLFPVSNASFSSNSQSVAAVFAVGLTEIYELTTGKVTPAISAADGMLNRSSKAVEPKQLNAVGKSFSHDRRSYATVSTDRAVDLWASDSNQHIGRIYVGHAAVNSADFSPDDSKIVLTCHDAIAEVWDIKTKQQVLKLWGHQGSVLTASYSPDGTRIVTGSRDNTARIWDAGSGKELLALRGHTAPVIEAIFSPDGTKILTRSEDGTARVWDSISAEDIHRQQLRR